MIKFSPGGHYVKSHKRPILQCETAYDRDWFSCFCFVIISRVNYVDGVFAIDKSKYESAHGTFLSSTEEGPALMYVVKGIGYVEGVRNIPGSWKDRELVEIEYLKGEPESVRGVRSATPYIVAIIASSAATLWAIYIFRKYPSLKNVAPVIDNHAPTESGGYYS